MLLTFHLPRGHGTYLKANETYWYFSLLNAVSVLNLLDVLAWGIDAATGAITKPEFKFYQIDFQPDGKEND